MKYSALSIIFLIFTVSGTAQQVFNFEGETLRYNAKYGFIKGGEVIISSKKVKYLSLIHI